MGVNEDLLPGGVQLCDRRFRNFDQDQPEREDRDQERGGPAPAAGGGRDRARGCSHDAQRRVATTRNCLPNSRHTIGSRRYRRTKAMG